MALAWVLPAATSLQSPTPFQKHVASSRAAPAIESGKVSSATLAFAAGAMAALRKGKVARKAAMEDMAKAVAEGRMITLEEAYVRKALGVFFLALFIWQATLVYTTGAATLAISGSSYATLALLASNAVGFGASGSVGLWGCVAALKWNMEGPFSFSEAPAEYLDFLQEKRRQMGLVIAGALVAGAAGCVGVAAARGEPEAALGGLEALAVLFAVTIAGLGAYGFTQGGDRRAV